ncbi:uncharacterized protein LOC133532344 isoform X3 [Cydia pomonella]|uniref:uncharacterized protein LOC133532344 isoform X3 n=1 Tax=Cydia pomonella TaxID=82600 RepID=UPI002ADD4F76|nr:uncharacterized protein LOC133532344 isoform X3 [Cydia pomonella]
MTTRSRGYNQDWDPMKEDFDNSSYDPQNADESGSGFVNLDHCRLYITNIPNGLSDDGLSTVFSKYGQLTEVFVSKNPDKRYALVAFETPGEAKFAMMKLNRTEPLKLNINVAHKSTARSKRPLDKKDNSGYRSSNSNPRNREDRSFRDDGSAGSRSNTSMPPQDRREAANVKTPFLVVRKSNFGRQESLANGDNMEEMVDDDVQVLSGNLEPDVNLELEKLKLEHLKLQEAQVMCKHRMLLLKQAEKKSSSSSRQILPDGRIVVRTVDKSEVNDADGSFGAGAGDASSPELCSCEQKCSWDSDGAASTASTCVLCSDGTRKIKNSADKSDSKCTQKTDSQVGSKTTFSKHSKVTDGTSKKSGCKKSKSSCDTTKYADFYSDSEDEADETNRLIQLRNTDYADIIEDQLKIVIALAGYPKSKMRLRQLELFQRSIAEVTDMQIKAGLLKSVPYFLDYYLNRGAIVCVCRDIDTRNWVIRISPGLQERMASNLILLKSKIKRLCLAYLKIPSSTWPATAQDTFKLLQYFNPTLKTDSWRVYSQKRLDDVEYTSFLIDRVSGEIIRGSTFKNVIDYEQMEFELSGYTEIYYECLMSDMKEDLHSVSSRVKLLNELRGEDTPRNLSDCSLRKPLSGEDTQNDDVKKQDENEKATERYFVEFPDRTDKEDCDKVKIAELGNNECDVLKKLKDVNYRSEKNEMIIWSEEINNNSKIDVANEDKQMPASESIAAESEKTESIAESSDNLIRSNSNVNIDSNRGIAYHRRTNYLHVEPELKIAITLDGYPQNKLEGTHIRRLKQLFKEYLHRDMKQQRFANLIIPKFQDIYLSNGAVIYICDSLETKDYLTEVLPKFVNSTGWKLIFRDIKTLVRYTRIVLRLPKELASVESAEIISKLQEKYPGLKPDCWKYYSDVAGKQKRQFGVDPESLEIIKSPDFDPEYDGEKLSFRIIDRQKRDSCFEENQDYDDENENKELKEKILKLLYVPVEADMSNSPLTRIRTNHYSDVVADDLKLYVGPTNYPESRVDENLFHAIKKTLENIVYKSFVDGDINEISMPKFHDLYLFDGVIFVICVNMASRCWIDEALTIASSKLQINLKSTEYRGAVGIVSMVVKTYLDTEEVISILQSNNPRLRTKYWRIISTVRAKAKLDVVLQIDKLSAQVIRSTDFNTFVGDNAVQFQLGHLQSLLKPLSIMEKLSKKHEKKLMKANATKREVEVKISTEFTFEELKTELKQDFPDLKIGEWDSLGHLKDIKNQIEHIDIKQSLENASDLDPKIIEPDGMKLSPVELDEVCKMVVKIPAEILPKEREDLNLIFDLLEDQNPGLNTELWTVTNDFGNYEKGKFILSIDKQSAAVIRSNQFSPMVVGHKLKFLL